jgi:hypothetical protein
MAFNKTDSQKQDLCLKLFHQIFLVGKNINHLKMRVISFKQNKTYLKIFILLLLYLNNFPRKN